MNPNGKTFLRTFRTYLSKDKLGHKSAVWLNSGGVHLFVRLTVHWFHPIGVLTTVDLANISMPEALQGGGIFKGMVDLCVRQSQRDAVYVQSVANPKFLEHFTRHGTVWIPVDGELFTYYRLTEAGLRNASKTSGRPD